MTRRHIHYEAAFEDYVRSRGWPYVAVDEQRKAIFAGARVKSFDLIVYPPGCKTWVVDIKGRKFPYEGKGGRRYWENWVTQDDLDGLAQWHAALGEEYEPIFMFAYWLLGPAERTPDAATHTFRGEAYAFLPVPASPYANAARRRSPKWGTVSVSVRRFQKLVLPMPAQDHAEVESNRGAVG